MKLLWNLLAEKKRKTSNSIVFGFQAKTTNPQHLEQRKIKMIRNTRKRFRNPRKNQKVNRRPRVPPPRKNLARKELIKSQTRRPALRNLSHNLRQQLPRGLQLVRLPRRPRRNHRWDGDTPLVQEWHFLPLIHPAIPAVWYSLVRARYPVLIWIRDSSTPASSRWRAKPAVPAPLTTTPPKRFGCEESSLYRKEKDRLVILFQSFSPIIFVVFRIFSRSIKTKSFCGSFANNKVLAQFHDL